MNYLFLRALSIVKAVLGVISTAVMAAYLYIGEVVKNGADKQIQRIKDLETTKIANAKLKVTRAAQQVLELEKAVPEVEKKAHEVAVKKINTIQTKLK